MMQFIADFHYQWAFVLAASMFFFCSQWVRPKFGLPASLLLAACAYSSLWIWVFKDNQYLTVDVWNATNLKLVAADSMGKLLILVVPMMLLAERRLTMLLLGEILIPTFVILNSAASLWQSRNGCDGLTCGGLIGNPSIGMSAMVCMLPVCVRSFRQWPIFLLAVAAVFVSKSSVALGLLATFSGMFFFYQFPKMFGWFMAFLSGMFWIVVGKVAFGKELFNDSDRFMIWKFMYDRWHAPWNIPFGTGFGTYHVFSINLQNFRDPATGQLIHQIAGKMWWNTLHNDFLQMLFECGAMGLLLLSLTYGAALFKTLKERDYFISMSIVLYGLYMFVNPALHNPIPALFGCWLFVYALRQNNTFKESLC